MSELNLEDAKRFLDVIHNADDDKLQMLLDAAEDEALQFMDRDNLIDWDSCPNDCENEPDLDELPNEAYMPPSVRLGIFILLQGSYQASPADQEQLRKVAETMLMPFRCRLGV